MSEKNINTVLYVMLVIAVILYVFVNMPETVSLYLARDSGYMSAGTGLVTGSADGYGSCSCSVPERQQADVSDENADENVPGLSAANADIETSAGSGRTGMDTANGSSDEGAAPGTGGSGLREDASSVYEEEKPKDTKHNVSPEGWHLYIDLDEKLMYVYKDGELVKKYEVSGGKPSSPSPLGTWRIISKDTWGEGFGGAWLGFNVPWGKYGIHGTTEPWAIGKSNNSKGCIRMRNKEVRELYKLVPYNTLVTVVHENRPFYPMRDGDVGFDVLAVEKALKKLGYYHGGEDGIFGSSLKKAVMEFQKDNKLYVTGVINNSTYEKLMKLEKEYDEEQEGLKKERKDGLKKLE